MTTAPSYPTLSFLQPRLDHILELEPRLRPILDQAAVTQPIPGYNRIRSYILLRNQITSLVGWYSEHPDLRTSNDYMTIIHAITHLLPHDFWDLYDLPPLPSLINGPNKPSLN